MKHNAVLLERCRLGAIFGVALWASACGGSNSTDGSSTPSESSPGSESSQATLKFDLDSPSHKTGTVVGNGTGLSFDYTRDRTNFVLQVTKISREPLVAYAATPNEYVERVSGGQLEIKWDRAPVDARTRWNAAGLASQARRASGDERLLTQLAARPEFPLLGVLHGALKTSMDEATPRTAPSVLPLPGDDPSGGTGAQCIQECIVAGHTTQECNRLCLGTPPYDCSPGNNQVNHDACVAGVDAWAVSCFADPIGFLSPFMDIGCFLLGWNCPTCDSVGRSLRDDCPPATVCQ